MKTYIIAVNDILKTQKAKYYKTYSESRAVRYAQKKRKQGFSVVIL